MFKAIAQKFKEFTCKWLVPGWTNLYKWMSVQFALALVFLDFLVDYWPAASEYIPERFARYMGFAIIVARIWRGWKAPKGVAANGSDCPDK